MNFNRVIVTGYLGNDPEQRGSGDNRPTNFSIAVTDRWKDAAGEKQERTNWFNVVAWNGLGDTAVQHIKKGSHVLVEGSLRTNEWEDKESGEKRSRIEIVATSIVFLNKKPDEQTEFPRAATAPARRKTDRSKP